MTESSQSSSKKILHAYNFLLNYIIDKILYLYSLKHAKALNFAHNIISIPMIYQLKVCIQVYPYTSDHIFLHKYLTSIHTLFMFML